MAGWRDGEMQDDVMMCGMAGWRDCRIAAGWRDGASAEVCVHSADAPASRVRSLLSLPVATTAAAVQVLRSRPDVPSRLSSNINSALLNEDSDEEGGEADTASAQVHACALHVHVMCDGVVVWWIE